MKSTGRAASRATLLLVLLESVVSTSSSVDVPPVPSVPSGAGAGAASGALDVTVNYAYHALAVSAEDPLRISWVIAADSTGEC